MKNVYSYEETVALCKIYSESITSGEAKWVAHDNGTIVLPSEIEYLKVKRRWWSKKCKIEIGLKSGRVIR